MSLLIQSPQVHIDKEQRKLEFFEFDLKAVKTIVDSAEVDYKMHYHAKTSVEMIFNTIEDLQFAAVVLLMHYLPLNRAADNTRQ